MLSLKECEHCARCSYGFAVVLILYPLSFGPACWIASRQPRMFEPITTAYKPLAELACSCPWDMPRRALEEWGTVGEKLQGPNILHDEGVAWRIMMKWPVASQQQLDTVEAYQRTPR